MSSAIKSVGLAAFLATFTLGSAFPARGDSPGSEAAAASRAIQERGEALLKQLVEVNRYWLLAPPETVINYGRQKMACLDQVVVNGPVSELPTESPPAARKAKAAPQYQHLTANSVEVTYVGISPAYAQAIAQVISVARATARDQFGFNMPRLITITVTAEPSRRVQLFNDGRDHFVLDVRSEAGLERPERTGAFQIYGLCHEVGHLAMYRVRDFDWMKGDAKEAWGTTSAHG